MAQSHLDREFVSPLYLGTGNFDQLFETDMVDQENFVPVRDSQEQHLVFLEKVAQAQDTQVQKKLDCSYSFLEDMEDLLQQHLDMVDSEEILCDFE